MKKYLPIYQEWIEAGQMLPVIGAPCPETSGLCDAFKFDENFLLMEPTSYDLHQIELEGLNTFAWASDDSDYLWYKFTPLRQNIVLLMAAMNGQSL